VWESILFFEIKLTNLTQTSKTTQRIIFSKKKKRKKEKQRRMCIVYSLRCYRRVTFSVFLEVKSNTIRA